MDRTAYMLGNSAAFLLVLIGTWVISTNNVFSDTWYWFYSCFCDRKTVLLITDARYKTLVTQYITEVQPQCVSIWKKASGPLDIGNINYDRGFHIFLDGKKTYIQVYVQKIDGNDKDNALCIQYPNHITAAQILSFFNTFRPKRDVIQTYSAQRTPTTNGKWGPVVFKMRNVLARFADCPLPYSGSALRIFHTICDYMHDPELIDKLPAILLVGEPGTAKTSIIDRLPRAKVLVATVAMLDDSDTFMSMIAARDEIVDPDEKFYFVIEELDKMADWTKFQHAILNSFLDGPYSHPGQVTIITCNHDQWLKEYPSLSRPGRMERVEVGPLSEDVLRDLLEHYRPEWDLPQRLDLRITIAELSTHLRQKRDLYSLRTKYSRHD